MCDEDYIEEKYLEGQPKPISIEAMKIIQKQMENSVCKINCDKNGLGTGFFCKISCPDRKSVLQALITNYHLIDKNYIETNNKITFSLNSGKYCYNMPIDKSRIIKFFEKPIDITLIEIKEADNIKNILYLKLNEKIFLDNPDSVYKNKTIYLLHYPKGKNIEKSIGIITFINESKYYIKHKCDSKKGSSGGPLLNLLNCKVMGIHKGAPQDKNKNYNFGTFIKIIIDSIKLDKNNFILNNTSNIEKQLNIIKPQSYFTKIEKEQAKKNGFLLLGKPMTGKSTLINVLFGQEIIEVKKSYESTTDSCEIIIYSLDENNYISLIDTPGLDDLKLIYDKDVDNRRSNEILDFLKNEDIEIKGILCLLNFQQRRLDFSEINLLFKYKKILFSFKNFWKYIIIIFTHYFSDPDEEEEDYLEKMKENISSSLTNVLKRVWEKDKELFDINDIINLKVIYSNLHWPIKREIQKIDNYKIKHELDIIFNKLIKKESLVKYSKDFDNYKNIKNNEKKGCSIF